MLAAADEVSIEDFFTRTGNKLDRSRFYHFPTRVDTDLFRPIDIVESRHSLGISTHSKVFVVTGRLCWIKGWDLILEAFAYLKSWFKDAQLIFVGDGEDHHKLVKRSEELRVENNIRITGFVPQSEVTRYMNAADVCLVGSHKEGWSLAMCEMIACGKAVVSTDVSGVREMVRQGENGFVVKSRDPRKYADKVIKAMSLENATDISRGISSRYSVQTLNKDLDAIWLR
jgi:glycosyltransferase involved in cell wall biosynthesis